MTNGLKFEGIFEEAYLERGRFVNFSLNAVDKAVYDRVMVGSDHQRVFANLERFIQRREISGSTVAIGASLVITQLNLNQIAPFIRYCREKGISAQLTTDCILSVEVEPMLAQAAIAEGYAASEGAQNGDVVGLSEYDWLLSIRHRVQPLRERFTVEERKRSTACHVAYERLFVDFEGTCQVCCQSWYPVGSLKKQSLAEIWNGDRMNRFRERLENSDYRDCGLTCIYNQAPASPRTSLMRKVAFKATRDPWLYLKKARAKRKTNGRFRKLRDQQRAAGVLS